MISRIKNIKESGLPVVNSGRAENAEDFFNQIIKAQFANKEVIKSIHSALIEYVNQDSAVYVLRLYGSDPKKRYELLRRGFLSQYPDGNKIVFCDNTFAMPFAAMKINGMAYSPEELLDYMSNPNLQCSFGSTREEHELAFYKYNSKSHINLNKNGWYLAHIIPVGYNYTGRSLSQTFRNPDRKEWEVSASGIRLVETPMKDTELSMLKAHFLRMVHPLNSFLVPKRSLVAYPGKNLGEEQELINIVQDYIKVEFHREYNELMKIMQVPPQDAIAAKTSGPIIWSESASQIRLEKRHYNKMHKAGTREKGADIYNTDEEETLERTLNSIGKGAFIKLYPLIKKNPSITIKEICDKIPSYKKYSPTSQQTRLSSSRSIITRNLDAAALEIIIASSHIDQEVIRSARVFLSEI